MNPPPTLPTPYFVEIVTTYYEPLSVPWKYDCVEKGKAADALVNKRRKHIKSEVNEAIFSLVFQL